MLLQPSPEIITEDHQIVSTIIKKHSFLVKSKQLLILFYLNPLWQKMVALQEHTL